MTTITQTNPTLRSSLPLRSTRRMAGFTLLEMMISLVIMSIAMVAIYSAVQKASGIYSQNAAITYIEASAGNITEKLLEEIAFADPISTEADGTGLNFWIPVDADGENGPLDDDGEIEWGWDSNLNYSRRISFEAVGAVSEADRSEDVNHDDDQADTFSVGRLVIETLDAAGASLGDGKPIGPPIVMVTSPNAGNDADGDGSADPVFARLAADGVTLQANGPILRVRLILGAEDTTQQYHMTTHNISIKLRNLE